MAPGGPLGPRGGNGRADGRDGTPEEGGGTDADAGGVGGALAGRAAGGGLDAAGAGGLVVRLPADFAGEFGEAVARDDAGEAGAAEPVRAMRVMLGCCATSERGPLPLGSVRRQ
jgi:hypothetical protein